MPTVLGSRISGHAQRLYMRAAPLQVTCRSASSRASSGGAGSTTAPPFSSASSRRSGAPRTDFEIFTTRLQEVSKLAQEAAEMAISSGPQGIRRTAQAAEAFLSLGREQIQRLQTTQSPDPPAVILRQLFERLGATYIKLGQFIASSPTIFPPDYVLEFQKCLDQTTPVPFDVIRRTVEAELGFSLEDVFESVDQIPLASASIAQVHAGVLRGSRREVVLKVLKPGVEDTLTTDLNFLYLTSRALELAAPQMSAVSLSAIAGDIKTSMLQEVDFRLEANHMEQFAAYLDSTGLRMLATVPQLYRQYCTKKVLVMERLRGAPLTDLDAIRSVARGVDPETILINALNVWFGSVVGAETFHADVHAGNLLVLPDGRVGFIDFGQVGRISQPTWRAIEALLRATATEDYDTMARALVTIGATSGDVDLVAFAGDLKELYTSLKAIDTEFIVEASAGGNMSATVAADDAALNRFLVDLVRVGEQNGVRFPREFALLLKQILYFDRYTRLLAPSLKVFEDSRIQMRDNGAGKGGKAGADWDLGPGEFSVA